MYDIFSPLKNLQRTQPRRTAHDTELNPSCGPVRKRGTPMEWVWVWIHWFSCSLFSQHPVSDCGASDLIPGQAQRRDVISLLSAANGLRSHSSENRGYQFRLGLSCRSIAFPLFLVPVVGIRWLSGTRPSPLPQRVWAQNCVLLHSVCEPRAQIR